MTTSFLDEIDYFDPEFGDYYDELSLWSAPFALQLLDRIPMDSQQAVLDVGSGTGFLTLEMAQRCGPGAKIYAVDPWNAAMKRLRRKLDFLGLQNVVLLEQCASKMELADNSIDLLLSNLGINNFDDPGAVLRELYRVAKPQAKLFLTTNLEWHMVEFYDVFRATLVELGQDDALRKLEQHIRHRGTLDSVSKMLSDGGFAVVNTSTGSFQMRFADGTTLLHHFFIRLAFMQEWAAIVSSELRQNTFCVLEQKLNSVAAKHGEFALTIPTLCVEAQKLNNN